MLCSWRHDVIRTAVQKQSQPTALTSQLALACLTYHFHTMKPRNWELTQLSQQEVAHSCGRCVHNWVTTSTDTKLFISLTEGSLRWGSVCNVTRQSRRFRCRYLSLKEKLIFPQRSRTRNLRSVRCCVVTHPCCFQVCELRQVAAVSWFQRFLFRFYGWRSLTWKRNLLVLFWDWYLRTALQKFLHIWHRLWRNNELIRTAWSNSKVD